MTPVLDERQHYRRLGVNSYQVAGLVGGVKTGTRGAAQGVIWEVSGDYKCVVQRLVLASFKHMFKTQGYSAASAFTAGRRFPSLIATLSLKAGSGYGQKRFHSGINAALLGGKLPLYLNYSYK